MPQRLPIVGVMGSGQCAHRERSEPLGRWLARRGVHLLTGGGGGVMEATARAFCEVPDRLGRSIGVLPARGAHERHETPVGYPNPWVEIPVFTHLYERGPRGAAPGSRNHINVLTADVVVALPGGPGTASEVELARRYGRPLIAFAAPSDEPVAGAGVESRSDLDGVVALIDAHLSRRSEMIPR